MNNLPARKGDLCYLKSPGIICSYAKIVPFFDVLVLHIFSNVASHLPPHAETDEGEDDDEDSGDGGPNGHDHDLAVDLALVAVVVAFTPREEERKDG